MIPLKQLLKTPQYSIVVKPEIATKPKIDDKPEIATKPKIAIKPKNYDELKNRVIKHFKKLFYAKKVGIQMNTKE